MKTMFLRTALAAAVTLAATSTDAFAQTLYKLIDKNGKIDKIWRGNSWTPAEVIEEIERHDD